MIHEPIEPVEASTPTMTSGAAAPSDTTSARMPAAERRRQLLDVSRAVLARNGYYETTMSDIADAAGVTKPVLYQHFESKRDLYTAVLEEVGDRLSTSILEAAEAAESPRHKVAAGYGALIDFFQTDNDGFRVLFSGTTRQDPEWAPIAQRAEHSIASGIADMMDIADMSRAHKLTLAHGVVGLAESMMRYWQSGQAGDLDLDDLLNDLVKLAWGGLRGLEA
ncbi:MAG: TetR/AcrR family transcriptional regulator [Actinomycetota bacterium]